MPQTLGAPRTAFLRQDTTLCGAWSRLTHSPRAMLQAPGPLSSPATLSTRQTCGSVEALLGFWLLLVHEGSRLVEKENGYGWPVQFLISFF